MKDEQGLTQIQPFWKNNPQEMEISHIYKAADLVRIKMGAIVKRETGPSFSWHEYGSFINTFSRKGNPRRVRQPLVFTMQNFYKNRRCLVYAESFGSLLVWAKDCRIFTQQDFDDKYK